MRLGLVLLHYVTLPTSENFCNDIKQEVDGLTHVDLEAACKKRKKSLVLGKIIKILYSVKDKIIIQVKEVLPNLEYGQKFNAVIQRTLAQQFTKYALKPGDSLAFYEPFVFLNPAFQSSEPKYLVEIGGLDNSKMWCAKSQSPLVKNKMSEKKVNHESKSMADDKNKQAIAIPDNQKGTLRKHSGAESGKDLLSDTKASNKDNLSPSKALISLPMRKNENEDKTAKNRNNFNIIEKESPDIRQRPQIQLPLNPQIPLNTKRLNPQYTYKTLHEVREDALLGEMGKVNIIVVVLQIVQALAKTSTGRFSLRCRVIDESTGLNNSFHLNFFTLDSNVIQEIEEGDILRLHRVKVELYKNIPDGRIFNNQDILLFKKNATIPITTAKNYQITEEDKRNLERLRKWQEESTRCCSEIRLLGGIQKEGEYHIACQLVSLELIASGSVKLRVTDGSVIRTLARGPAPSHLEVTDQAACHLVTEIEVFNQLNLFANLKAGTFLHLCKVKAVKTDKLRLKLNAQGAPMLLSEDYDKVMEINQRLEVMKGRIEKSLKNNEQDHEVSPNNQPSGENNCTHRTRNRTAKFNSSDCEKVNNIDSCTKQIQIVETTDEVSGITKVASEGTLADNTRITTLNQLCTDEGEDFNKTQHKQLHKMSPCNTCPRQNVSRHSSKAPQMKEDENGLKKRKPLFTANYSDLSEATDELSEVLESGSEEKGGEGVTGPEVVVVPANTSFVDVMQLLETKCSPRKRIHSHSQTQNSQERKTVDNCAKEKYPYVKLIKLDNECNYSPSRATLDKSCTSSRSKKLSVEDDDVNTSAEECIEIASTVKNMSYQKVFSENTIRNKGVDNESLSTQENPVDLLAHEDIDVSTIPKVQINRKVSHWLSQCHGDLHQTIEVDPFEAQKIILGLDVDKPLNMSECIRTSSRRLRVFLDRIIPDPSTKPLDLVSGVCVNGCKDYFVYSCIHWQKDNDNFFPLCPNCKKLKLKNNLLLTLFFELKVIDMKGHSDMVMVCMDDAETFLNCSTKDFVNDQEIRKSRVTRLTNSSLLYSLNQNEPGNKPILDLSVIVIKNRLILVNTTFKLL